MNQYFTHDEIQVMIKSLEKERYNFIDDKDLNRLINILSKLPKEQAEKLLNGSFVYNEYIKANVNELTLNKIINTILSVDQVTLSNYEMAIKSLKESGMNDTLVHAVAKQMYSSIYEYIKLTNRNVFELSSDFLEQASKVSSTFSDMNNSLKNEIINTIYLNCLSRMKTFWQKVEANDFTEVVDTLMNEMEDDNFTEQEIVELSKKCATIFCESSRAKIMGVEVILGDYKDFCLELVENSVEMTPENIKKLKEFKTSQVFRTAGSIAKANTRTLFHTSEFLKGKSIGEIFEHKIGTDDRHAELYEKFKDVKINLSINDSVWVLTKNPSLFTNSVTNTLEFLDKVHKSIISSYGKKADNFDFNTLITRDNFLKGIPKNVDYENISKNIELLSCFMNVQELASYLSSDMNIFNIDYEKLHDIVLGIFVKNKKSEDIIKKLNNILKNKVDEEIKSSTKKAKDKSVNKNSESNIENHNAIPNVHLNFNEINDFAFDFDLNKLEILLGKYYKDFISDLKKSGVDSSKIQDIVNRTNPTIKNIIDSENTVDANVLLKSIHTGYETGTNRIELLWQLQRNINSAKNLIDSFAQKGELDIQKMYVVSSNYFKIAGEKDLFFKHLDKIEEHYKNTADYLVGKIEKNFQELTMKFALVMGKDSKQLDNYTQKLIKQRQIIEKQIQGYSFENLDKQLQIDLEERKQILLGVLSDKQIEYEKKQQEYQENKFKIRDVKTKIQEEKETPTDKYDLNNIDGELNLFHFAYVGKREQELHDILDSLLQNKDELENVSKSIINEIAMLKKELSDIDEKLKSSKIYNILTVRINELEARLNYALKVKQAIDKNESEK